MIDKSKGQEGFDDLDKLNEEFEFDDDLDLEADSTNRDTYDLGTDDLLMSNDDSSVSKNNNFSSNLGKNTSESPSFLKNYGFVLVAVIVIGYFTFKYTTSMFLGSKQPVQQVNQQVPVVSQSAVKEPKQTQEIESLEPTADKALEESLGRSLDKNNPQELKQAQESLNLDSSGMKPLNGEPKVAVFSDGSAVDFRDSENARLAAKINELLKSIESVSTKIDQKAGKNSNDIENMKNLMNSVNSKMTEVADYVQSAGKAIGLLSKQVKYQELVLATVVGSSNAAVAASDGTTAVDGAKLSSLTVDAVSSGRAWLKASNGKAMTVAVGDDIPGYGRVVEINSINATVTTDKGKIIK